jgi:cysteinyl-tRNA synthetase
MDPEGAAKTIDTFRTIDSVLNIIDFGEAFSDHEVQTLIKERDKARAEKNWDLADQIRTRLRSRGIIVQDQP